MKRGFSIIELVLAIVVIAISMASLPRIVSSTINSSEFILPQQEAVLQSKALMGKIIIRPFDSVHVAVNCRTKDISDPTQCDKAEFWKGIARGFEKGTSESRLFIKEFKSDEWNVPVFNEINAKGIYYDANGIITKNKLSRTFGDKSAGGSPVAISSTSSTNFVANSFGLNPGMNDIDDFSGASGNFIGSFQGNNADSIFELNFATTVTYFNDASFINPGKSTISENINTSATSSDRVNAVTNIKFVEIITTLQQDINAKLPLNERRHVVLKSFAANVGTPNVYKVEWK